MSNVASMAGGALHIIKERIEVELERAVALNNLKKKRKYSKLNSKEQDEAIGESKLPKCLPILQKKIKNFIARVRAWL